MIRRLAILTVFMISVVSYEADSALIASEPVRIGIQAVGGSPSTGKLPAGPSASQVPFRSSTPLIIPSGVQSTKEGQYSITSVRPLAVAAQLLSLKLGAPVSYEDATWLAPSDVAPARMDPSVLRSAGPNYVAPIVPRESTFDFSLPSLEAMRISAQPEAIIESVIEAYHRFRNPGQFKLIRFGEGEFSIAAAAAAGIVGKMTPQSLPLDTRISFPAKKRTLFDGIQEICDRVSAAGSIPLSCNTPLAPYLNLNFTEIGADNEVARDVLSRLLRRKPEIRESPVGKTAWLVFSDPNSRSHNAVLSIYGVFAEVRLPDGSARMEGVSWAAEGQSK